MPLHPLLEKMLAQPGRPEISGGTPSDARAVVAASRAALGRGPDIGSVRDLEIPTRSGVISGRLFRPATVECGVIVYLHGGGWMAGALDDFDALARTLAARTNCAVLLVDYRLAPEHPFPAGLEDAEDSIRWAARLWRQLSGVELPLIVAGDSAGANLGIVASRALHHELNLALLALVYPVTDAPMHTASYQTYGRNLPLTSKDMEWFFQHYAPEAQWMDPRISPLRASTQKGFPPTWIATAEYDVLRDEGEKFAARLEADGVPVALRRYDGLAHGFIRMMNLIDSADMALSDMAAAAIRACQNASRESKRSTQSNTDVKS